MGNETIGRFLDMVPNDICTKSVTFCEVLIE